MAFLFTNDLDGGEGWIYSMIKFGALFVKLTCNSCSSSNPNVNLTIISSLITDVEGCNNPFPSVGGKGGRMRTDKREAFLSDGDLFILVSTGS